MLHATPKANHAPQVFAKPRKDSKGPSNRPSHRSPFSSVLTALASPRGPIPSSPDRTRPDGCRRRFFALAGNERGKVISDRPHVAGQWLVPLPSPAPLVNAVLRTVFAVAAVIVTAAAAATVAAVSVAAAAAVVRIFREIPARPSSSATVGGG